MCWWRRASDEGNDPQKVKAKIAEPTYHASYEVASGKGIIVLNHDGHLRAWGIVHVGSTGTHWVDWETGEWADHERTTPLLRSLHEKLTAAQARETMKQTLREKHPTFRGIDPLEKLAASDLE